MLTFLGGPRACIGYRFSLVEFVLTISNLITYLLHFLQDESIVIHADQSFRF